MNKRLVIVQVAGLGHEFLTHSIGTSWNGLSFQPIASVFPAVTSTVQASFRTASPPSQHGMVANGLFQRDLRRALFWEQSSALVSGPRIWDAYRKRGKRVALLFWQQSLGEDVDMLLSPAPIHKHGGGLVQSVYSKPAGLYADLCRRIGRRFQLHRYWGPIASPASSDWIAQATALVLASGADAPDLCLTYLPALDYDLQRHGPAHASATHALETVMKQLTVIHEAAARNGYDLIVFGDYAIGPATTPVFPNRALLTAGLFRTRIVDGRHYPDFHDSEAFALVDHEIAHVYVKHPGALNAVKAALRPLDGVDCVLGPEERASAGLNHPNSGEIVLTAKPGTWFAYPWWTDRRHAPDYAGHVDIHNKPGYDPCELFFGWPPPSVSQDPRRIRGSHGSIGPDRAATWASTLTLPNPPATLIELAAGVRQYLDNTP